MPNNSDYDVRAMKGAHGGQSVERAAQPPKPYYDVANGGCWIWNRSRSRTGYGQTRYGGRLMSAHRAYHAHYIGPVPAGRVVMHTCDDPLCVNPDHLRLGTQRDNLRDRDGKGRGRVPRRVLTSHDMAEIRRRYAAGGITQAQLADEYGVWPSRISQITRGTNR